jgi:hypothetical protein
MTPSGWAVRHHAMSDIPITTVDDGTYVLSSATQAEGDVHQACTEAFVVDVPAQTPAGTADSPVVVAAWPDDPNWGTHVASEANMAMPPLETLFDSPMPGGGTPPDLGTPGPGVVIREAAAEAYPHSYGALWPTDGELAVTEQAVMEPGAASVPLARAWLGPQTNIVTPWLREGLAAWAGYSAIGLPCRAIPPYPPSYAEKGAPDLDDWVVPGHYPSEWEMWNWQVATACAIVEEVDGLVDPATMSDQVRAMFTVPQPLSAADWLASLGPVVADDPLATGVPPALVPTLETAGADY